MIMPLQNALTCTLPSSSETLKTHNPFMQGYVIIQGMCEADIVRRLD
jgi:hypothetical protein